MNKRLKKKLEKQVIKQCRKITLNKNDVLLTKIDPNIIKPEEYQVIFNQLHNIFKDNQVVVLPDFIRLKNMDKENVVTFLEEYIDKLKNKD